MSAICEKPIMTSLLSTVSPSMAYNNRMKRGPDDPIEPPSITLPPSGSTVWMSTGNTSKAPSKTVKRRRQGKSAEVELDPGNVPAWVALLEVERGTGEAKTAIKELKAAISSWTVKEQCSLMAECVKDVWRMEQCELCFSDMHE